MNLTVVPLDDDTWPGPFTPDADRVPSRFSTSWERLLADLDSEVDLTANGGRTHANAVLEVPFPKSRIYADGRGVHADATNPRHPGVALSFDIPNVGPVRFACDQYKYGGARYLRNWQSNLRAITLTLEALRAVDRHGAAKTGQQYRGFAELGTGLPMGPGEAPAMSLDTAARLLAEAACIAFGDDWIAAEDLLVADDRASLIRGAYRDASRTAHPDHGGDPDVFDQLTKARDLLLAAA